MNRRGFITGLAAAFAAPAIVRAGSLMPVKAMPSEEVLTYMGEPLQFDGGFPAYIDVVRRAFVPRLFVQVYAESPVTTGVREGWLVQ